MSFDLFLQHFSAGESAPIEPRPVESVLTRNKYTGPGQFGFYRVEFDDGAGVEFNAGGLDGSEPFAGCAFHIRGISPLLIAFVLEVARGGDFVIFNAQGKDSPESPVVILVGSHQKRELPGGIVDKYSSMPVCTSAEMLGDLLFPGYEGWLAFRDQVVKGP